MSVAASTFDFTLPTPATWFYLSALLAVALFFKFSRLLSMRNVDVLTIYAFTPGLLLLGESATRSLGYLWLICASGYFLFRCLLDLSLVRRPALGSNLDTAGLAWLGGALFVSLVAITARQPTRQEVPNDGAKSTLDTFPGLSMKYIEPYAPADVDDSRLRLWAERGLALLCHLSIAVALVLIGGVHFEDVRAGMAAATFYLLLPYNFLLLPDSPLGIGRWDHAWAMAWVLWSVLCFRRPLLAGSFLGVATAPALYLVVILPAWVSFYRRRGTLRFLTAFLLAAGIALALLGGLLWLHGELPSTLRFDWRPWRRPAPGTPGFWEHLPVAYWSPVFILGMALVVVTFVWPSPKNLAQLIALSAATLISVQFWYADRGGIYILWYLPLLLLLVFRPNLATTLPPCTSHTDWPARLWRWLGSLVRWPFSKWAGPPAKSPTLTA